MIDLLIMLFPARQLEMLVIQMFVAPFLLSNDFSMPPKLFHNPLGLENGVLITVMANRMEMIGHQMWIIDIPPVVSITDTGNVPSGVVNCSGNRLTQLYCFVHSASCERKKRATCRNDKPPSYEVIELLDAWKCKGRGV